MYLNRIAKTDIFIIAQVFAYQKEIFQYMLIKMHICLYMYYIY